MGDPAGIGGEIILKSLKEICKRSMPVIVGDLSAITALRQKVFSNQTFHFKRFKEGGPGEIEFLDMACISSVDFGSLDRRYGEASYRYITEALKLTFLGEVSAMVTCPISKASIHLAGVPFTGHTELLAHFCGVTHYIMMMANPIMRVSLVTIHIPLRSVAPSVSRDAVLSCISITEKSLRNLFGLSKPHIKVCGLNPHAGENRTIGDEEVRIQEAIDQARSMGINVYGPYPADTLFHKVDCDAYVAMYHDQGLIPVKTLDFKRTVNVTLGLPFVRTSPGHGTGFDIAGTGLADPSSFIEAYRLAERLSG